MRRHVRRWGVGLLGALTLVGLGLLYADPTLLTAALIPLVYVLYGTLSRVPEDARVTADRTIQPTNPEPGEPVRVRLRVQNESDSALSDVRVVDGVPEELVVTKGSPRLAEPLSPGESVSTSYVAVAKRGEFAFDDPSVRIRSLSGSRWVTRAVSASGETQFTCTNVTGEPPIVDQSIQRQGTLSVDAGGHGLEFYATRQYKRGDPVNRIDWHHVAKTGEFITVQYRKEQAVRAVVIVDARRPNNVTPAAGYPTGTQVCAYAGERLFDALEDAGVVTSATALGFEDGDLGGLVGPDGLPWIDPEHETGKRGRASLLFERLQNTPTAATSLSLELPRRPMSGTTDGWVGTQTTPWSETVESRLDVDLADQESESAGARADGGETAKHGDQSEQEVDEQVHRLLTRLPPDTQVVLCSPLLDNWPVELASALEMREYPLVVVSPNVVGAGMSGQRLAAIARRSRLRTFDMLGIETVDWPIAEPLDYAVRNALPTLLADQ